MRGRGGPRTLYSHLKLECRSSNDGIPLPRRRSSHSAALANMPPCHIGPSIVSDRKHGHTIAVGSTAPVGLAPNAANMYSARQAPDLTDNTSWVGNSENSYCHRC